MRKWFGKFASACANATGSPIALVLSVVGTIVWGAVGPLFGYSDTWQLWANTVTTIITFLLVFIIQISQNRDTKAIQAKLDELISATGGARDEMIKAEERDEAEIDARRLDPNRD